MTATRLQSTAPRYPLLDLFRRNRIAISATAGVGTFAAVASAPRASLRSYLIAGAAGAAAGLATAVAGELIDVVADTLLPQ